MGGVPGLYPNQKGPAGEELYEVFLLRAKVRKGEWWFPRVAPAPSGSRVHCGRDRRAKDPGFTGSADVERRGRKRARPGRIL